MGVLVTGGAGYIGSHTVVELLNNEQDVIVVDNLVNSSLEALDRVKVITGRDVKFLEGDILDSAFLRDVFASQKIDAVIHFAALKAVGESVLKPLEYYHNNVAGTVSLLKVMQEFDVQKMVFSSSATVYGEHAPVPYVESYGLGNPSSPYGKTKVMVEQILLDTAVSNPKFKAASLRYFNPIGSHPSGMIGEDPLGIPNNLMPFVSQVAVGKRDVLNIFGNDYETKDGTCERDYLHVMDLAEGHLAALDWLNSNDQFFGVEAFNLGTGSATSVLEIVNEFTRVTGEKVPYQFAQRRDGDLPAFWACAQKAHEALNWSAKRDLRSMLEDTWRWQSLNPNGYKLEG